MLNFTSFSGGSVSRRRNIQSWSRQIKITIKLYRFLLCGLALPFKFKAAFSLSVCPVIFGINMTSDKSKETVFFITFT